MSKDTKNQLALNLPQFNVPWLGPRWDGGSLKIMPNPHAIDEVLWAIAVINKEGKLRLVDATDTTTVTEVPLATKPDDLYEWLEIEFPKYTNTDMTGYLVVSATPTAMPAEWMNTFSLKNADTESTKLKVLVADAPQLEITRPMAVNQSHSDIQAAIDLFVATNPNRWEFAYLEKAVVQQRQASTPSSEAGSIFFALASCQYPSGIFDMPISDETYNKLAADTNLNDLILIGDQIYADATAGVLDPTRKEDRYDRKYVDWLQTPSVRAVLRRMSFAAMLDDHEIYDNYEPAKLTSKQKAEYSDGIGAYWRYQRMATPNKSLYFLHNIDGHGVFMLDTRTEREPRTWGDAAAASAQPKIMSNSQQVALESWLETQLSKDINGVVIPKLIASPVWLLPHKSGRLVSGLLEPEVPHLCDTWQGYPASLHAVLGFIAKNQIKGVVFLTGDAHLGGYTKVELTDNSVDQNQQIPIVIHMLHTPALYAPISIVNNKPHEFLSKESLNIQYDAKNYICEVQAHLDEKIKGYLAVHVSNDSGASGAWVLTVKDAQGQSVVAFSL